MASKMTTYDPKKVTTALGSHIVSGYADDSFISIEKDGDGTTYVQGCDGEIARSIDPTTIMTLTLTVLQESATNAWLERQFARDQESGTGTFSVNIKDIMGGEKFSAPFAWVTKPATFARGKQQTTREWSIATADGVFKN